MSDAFAARDPPDQLALPFPSAPAGPMRRTTAQPVPLHGQTPFGHRPEDRASGENVILAGQTYPIELFLSAHADVINYVLSRQDRIDDYQYLDRAMVLRALVRCVAIGATLKPQDLTHPPPLHMGRWRSKAAFHVWAIGSKLAHAAKEARMAARGYKRACPELIEVNLRALEELLGLPSGTAHEWATGDSRTRRRPRPHDT